MSDFTTIGRFPYRHDGEYAKGFLDDAGIACLLLVDDAQGIFAFGNTVRLVVSSSDVERASKVLLEAGLTLD